MIRKDSKVKKRRHLKKSNQFAVGDLVRCFSSGKKSCFLTGIVVKKIKRSKVFFDYVYYVATKEGVFRTPDIVISKVLSRA